MADRGWTSTSSGRQDLSVVIELLAMISPPKIKVQEQIQKSTSKDGGSFITLRSRSESTTKGFLTDAKRQGWLTVRDVSVLKRKKARWVLLDPFNEYLHFFNKPAGFGSKVKATLRMRECLFAPKGDKIYVNHRDGIKMVLIPANPADHAAWCKAFTAAKKFLDSWDLFLQEVLQGESNRNSIVSQAEAHEAAIDSGFIAINRMDETSKNVTITRRALDAVVDDVNGKSTTLSSLVHPVVPTLIILLRHYGCTLSRQSVSSIIKRQAEITKMGIHMVIVAPGSVDMLSHFAKEYDFQGAMCVDSRRVVYNLFSSAGVSRYAVRQTGYSDLWKRMYDKGYMIKPEEYFDPQQLGGIYLVSPNSGTILNHSERFAGDSMEITMLMSVMQDYVYTNILENYTPYELPPVTWQDVQGERKKDNLIAERRGWNVETGRDKTMYRFIREDVLEHSQYDVSYFKHHFNRKDFSIFIGDINKNIVDVSSVHDPFIIMIRHAAQGAIALLWTSVGIKRYLIGKPHGQTNQEVIRYIKGTDRSLKTLRAYQCKEEDIGPLLVQMEMEELVRECHISLTIRSEADRPALLSLLTLLCQCNDKDLRGEEKVEFTYRGVTVVLHIMPSLERSVSPVCILVTSTAIDLNEVEESPIKSLFTVKKSEGKTWDRYELAVATRDDVTITGPFIPNSVMFGEMSTFRDFLLCKVINSHREMRYKGKQWQESRCQKLRGAVSAGFAGVTSSEYIKHGVSHGTMRNRMSVLSPLSSRRPSTLRGVMPEPPESMMSSYDVLTLPARPKSVRRSILIDHEGDEGSSKGANHFGTAPRKRLNRLSLAFRGSKNLQPHSEVSVRHITLDHEAIREPAQH
ncbi:hypothetical protein PROFUN_10771 [Planoprotostelium fungivorum]|uniref:PH domain-containing protein n=1 Tax=Planoprotostelium fungivorum TaxID=1890364 RepID=A0A2P6NCW4_9EUKA|nr:hypothetical protein PROFUN_10771 [Planoprotostelium fungivorum]